MAMIICSECGTEISDQSDNCIKCGANLNSLALVEKIKENRQNPCKNDLQNPMNERYEIVRKHDKEMYSFMGELMRDLGPFGLTFRVALPLLIFLFSFTDMIPKGGGGFLTMMILATVLIFVPHNLAVKKDKKIFKAVNHLEHQALPCLKKIYPIVDSSSISRKFDYILRNEKFTFEEGSSNSSKEKKEFSIYLKAFELDADAIIIENQDTSSIVEGSVSTEKGKVSGSTSTWIYDNIYVSYVKLKD